MLKLEDRIYVAMGARMGIQLSADEVAKLGELLVNVREYETRGLKFVKQTADSAVRLFK